MSWLSLFLTQKCNRQCNYCDIGQIPIKDRKHLDWDLLETFLPLIVKQTMFNKIGLTGGEIGYLNEDQLTFILESLNQKYTIINTNGLFMKRYFEKFYSLIDLFIYHPVEEIQPFISDMINDEKVIHLFPIHKQNLQLLPQFLETHKQYKISLSPYDSKFDFKDDPYKLSRIDLHYIYKLVCDYDNIVNKTYFQDLVNIKDDTLKLYRQVCFNRIELYPAIDFVNGLIKKCVCSHTRSSSVELTQSNFLRLLNNALTFDTMDLCDNCLHIIQYKHALMNHVIRR